MEEFLAPFGMALPPFFDDGRDRPRGRIYFIAAVCFGFGFVWAIVDYNTHTIRPHTGHLVGVAGILGTHFWDVFFGAIVIGASAFPFFFCYDRVAAECWGYIRRFREDRPNAILLVCLTAVAVLATCIGTAV